MASRRYSRRYYYKKFRRHKKMSSKEMNRNKYEKRARGALKQAFKGW